MLLWILNHIPDIFIHSIVVVGIIVYFFGNLLPVPKLGLLSPQSSGVLVLSVGLFLEGLTTGTNMLQSEIDQANKEIARINEQSKQITEKVVIKYVAEQKQVKEKGDQIVKYITTNNDKQCTVFNSTVELLNSAAENRIPEPTRGTDDTSSGVNLSTITEITVKNYNTYNQLSTQLSNLQYWIKQQEINK